MKIQARDNEVRVTMVVAGVMSVSYYKAGETSPYCYAMLQQDTGRLSEVTPEVILGYAKEHTHLGVHHDDYRTDVMSTEELHSSINRRIKHRYLNVIARALSNYANFIDKVTSGIYVSIVNMGDRGYEDVLLNIIVEYRQADHTLIFDLGDTGTFVISAQPTRTSSDIIYNLLQVLIDGGGTTGDFVVEGGPCLYVHEPKVCNFGRQSLMRVWLRGGDSLQFDQTVSHWDVLSKEQINLGVFDLNNLVGVRDRHFEIKKAIVGYMKMAIRNELRAVILDNNYQRNFTVGDNHVGLFVVGLDLVISLNNKTLLMSPVAILRDEHLDNIASLVLRQAAKATNYTIPILELIESNTDFLK